jgi:DNA-binding LytR/AlgR family response regulator
MEETRRSGELPYEIWKPFVWEFSSAVSIIILFPTLVWLLDKFPLNWTKLKFTFVIYFIASLIYSGLHILGMVSIREVIYWIMGQNYDIGDLYFEILYEYRKDVWSFIFLLAFIASYRFTLSRLQGEASLVDEGEGESKLKVCDRLLVKKLGKEFIVKVEDIEWLESSGNYVNLHIKGRIYPARVTLSGLISKISEQGFCRIHRSYAINLDEVDSLTSQSSGDSEITLKSGKTLNLSRSYKEDFRLRLE